MNLKQKITRGVVFGLLMMSSACSTITIRDRGTDKISVEPTWTKTENFFLWGLVGTGHVDVKQVCQGQNPVQIQAQHTFVDGLLGFVTLGIYYPRTSKVWCE